MFLRKCWLCFADFELCFCGDRWSPAQSQPERQKGAPSSHQTCPGKCLSSLEGSGVLQPKSCLICLSRTAKEQKAMGKAWGGAWQVRGGNGVTSAPYWEGGGEGSLGLSTLWSFIPWPIRSARWQRRGNLAPADEESFSQSLVPCWEGSPAVVPALLQPIPVGCCESLLMPQQFPFPAILPNYQISFLFFQYISKFAEVEVQLSPHW